MVNLIKIEENKYNGKLKMSQINMEIIKKFKEAFKFYKEADQESLNLYLNEDTKKEYEGITWLYECDEQSAAFIGIEDNEVFAIDSEGYLVSICEGLENIPYELIRIDTLYCEDELVEDFFKYNKDFETDLLKYEEWCKNNNVILDIQKVYHDNYGNLFKQYFDKK